MKHQDGRSIADYLRAYGRIVDELRAMGLSDAMICELLDDGKCDQCADDLIGRWTAVGICRVTVPAETLPHFDARAFA